MNLITHLNAISQSLIRKELLKIMKRTIEDIITILAFVVLPIVVIAWLLYKAFVRICYVLSPGYEYLKLAKEAHKYYEGKKHPDDV